MSDDHLFLRMPTSIELPNLDWTPVEIAVSPRFGGMVVRDPMRVIIIETPPPMPDAPGVDAIVAAGWSWYNYAFRLGPVALDTDRVLAGRYANRLPTNRRAKRTAAKARRRARKGGRP